MTSRLNCLSEGRLPASCFFVFLSRLRRHGVAVLPGVLAAECDRLNAAWFTFIREGRPHVTLKAAVTLDGRTATRTGDSRWVTGAEARAWVHRLRDRVDAVLVGAGTARADDPALTTRLPGGRGRDPLRVVLDTDLRLPDNAPRHADARSDSFHPKPVPGSQRVYLAAAGRRLAATR